ncbi:MAG: response regulator, partial [Nannocystaceae bacterium]
LSSELVAGGFDVISAADGVEAGVRLADHPDIALAIVDLHMPRMNGHQLIEQVRRDLGLKDLPIVMLTTDKGPDNLGRAVDTGATGWVLKPYDPERLLETIRRIIARTAVTA